jgi:NAD+ kinase
MFSIRKALLVCKQSAYSLYFLKNNVIKGREITRVIQKDRARFEDAHRVHYETLERVKSILHDHKIPFEIAYRGKNKNYQEYDFIITVGGDGTFLEAARNTTDQVILGVNSAPNFSVGRFCPAHQHNFEYFLKQSLQGKVNIKLLPRLRVDVDGTFYPVEAINDLLICHRNPAFLCRYYLKVGKVSEEQRSSGIWISTPAGSSGGLKSSGGIPMNISDRKIQYLPREIYQRPNLPNKLLGGIFGGKQTIRCVSLMRNGMIYLDGAHHHFPFPYGSCVNIKLSPRPLRVLGIDQ